MLKRLVILSTIMILCSSCASTKFEPYHPNKIDIVDIQDYSIQPDLDKLEKPSKIETLTAKIVDGHLEFTDAKDADYIIVAPDEFNKVNQLKELCITYKAIIYKEEDLINLKNHTINEQNRLIKLLEGERDLAMNAWTNSENMYRQEVASHTQTNIINKGMTYITVGSLVLLAIAL